MRWCHRGASPLPAATHTTLTSRSASPTDLAPVQPCGQQRSGEHDGEAARGSEQGDAESSLVRREQEAHGGEGGEQAGN
jgi:hypothetical protein